MIIPKQKTLINWLKLLYVRGSDTAISTETIVPKIYQEMPFWYDGLEERQAKMRKKMPHLASDDQEDNEFVDVEEITEESNANWKTSKDEEKHSEISDVRRYR